MKKFKPFVLVTALLITVTLIVPTILVLPFGAEKASGKLEEPKAQTTTTQPEETILSPSIDVAVYRTATEEVERIPLEEYVVGVVASEMPADFAEEALKAQALTARTYIVKQMLSEKKLDLPKDANVADSIIYQVYKSPQELKNIWSSDYNWKIEKIQAAVKATTGKILTYDGLPIDATFFSTSNGYTENAEAIWSNSLPYLKSVESPWDKQSPKFSGQEVVSVKEFEAKLGVKVPSGGKIEEKIERTAGKRVAKVVIDGKELSGKDIREKLGLMSTDFTWERKGSNIVIETKGYGHGVGMSQYGANGMAQAGKNYEEIVLHYYKGVQITNSEPYITTITAKK